MKTHTPAMGCAAEKISLVRLAKPGSLRRSEMLGKEEKKEGISARVPVSLQGTRMRSVLPRAAWVASAPAKESSRTTAT